MKTLSKYKVIGLMSGTSLDGLDIVCCEFSEKNKKWSFRLKASETVKYTTRWRNRLGKAHLLSGEDLQLLHNEFGFFIGRACNDFIKKNNLKGIHFISSHGHTVFHQPDKKFTFQLGNGFAIHGIAQLPVVNDFRTLDVINGGQGAPLVPIGDQLLFSQYDICLNLGGIANLSMITKGKRIAYDICFVNMGLNHLAKNLNKEFDNGGIQASKGNIDGKVLKQLEAQYTRWREGRPSLGREGFEKHIQPILDNESVSTQNRLRSFVESIALEISNSIPTNFRANKLLATGGGALNHFLIKTIKEKLKGRIEVIVPDLAIINYKEAIVFGFLGVLRTRNEINVLKSVTGAKADSSSGTMTGFKLL